MNSWIGQRSKPESYHFDSFCTGKSVSLWWAMKVMTIPRSSQTRTSSSRYINTDMVGYSELMSYPWYCRLKKDEKGIYKDVSMAGDLLYGNLQRFVPSVFYNHSSFAIYFCQLENVRRFAVWRHFVGEYWMIENIICLYFEWRIDDFLARQQYLVPQPPETME